MLNPEAIAGTGWLPDPPDGRDRAYKARRRVGAVYTPPSVDLRGALMPDVYWQDRIGSCGPMAVAAMAHYVRRKQGVATPGDRTDWVPSRLFLYYEARKLLGRVTQDSGSTLRDNLRVVSALGLTKEKLWPYDIARFAVEPPAIAYQKATKFQVLEYLRVDNLSLAECLDCLASGYPFVIGITTYPSFRTPAVTASGIVPTPNPSRESPYGGHALMVCGYDQGRRAFLARNSWSSDWGIGGYCWIGFAYICTRMAADGWTIRTIEK